MYHGQMKLFTVLIAAAAAMGAASATDFANIKLANVKTVYLLPMSNGLDQYLAVRLTTAGVLDVVTDPKKADAVFTDHIGADFEQTFNDLFGAKAKDKDSAAEDSGTPAIHSLSRGKGSVFLVDRRTREVLWSMYARPKSAQSDDMNDLAKKIASALEKDRKQKSAPKK